MTSHVSARALDLIETAKGARQSARRKLGARSRGPAVAIGLAAGLF